MFREEVLDNETRRKIYWYVKTNPGLHLRELQRRLKIPLSSLDYHLDYLVRQDLLYREGDGFYTRYFDEDLDKRDREILSILRQRRLREIFLVVISESKVPFSYLMARLNIPASTLSLYLKKLVENDLVERHSIGREKYYTIKDEAKVANLLVLYKTSFMDRLIDNALITLLETSFKGDPQKNESK
jgi:predicted transcriptional regulator